MLNRAAARVSLRSRERKLRLFLDLFDPGPETTVVDVGVTDAPFGGEGGSSDNFFEARYPWPAQITAVGRTGLERFAAAFPQVTIVQADGRALPFVHWLPDGDVRRRALRARGFDDVLDPLGPRELASLFPYPVRLVSRGMTLVAVGPL